MYARTAFVNFPDARRLARRSVPRTLFDYIDGGAEGEVTMVENERAFRTVTFRPQVGVWAEQPCLETTVVGTRLSMPVILAPCGLVQIMHPDGVIGVARAARVAGTVSVLSTFSGAAPEILAPEPGSRWFQLYATDRRIAEDLIGRAVASGFDALVVTMDSVVAGKRERELRYGAPSSSFRFDARTALRFAPQAISRPRWLFRTVAATLSNRGGPLRVAAHSPQPVRLPSTASAASPSLHEAPFLLVSPFTWEDIAWIRDQWSGPLLVKGILSGKDALASLEAGADGVIVSNHGGRQLDGVPSTLSVLPEIVDAVGSRVDVLLDGGVRSGGDVLKALALGARAVLIGRPYLYALAAAGEAGVERMLKIFRTDMCRTMMLLGCRSVADLDPSWVREASGCSGHQWEKGGES